MAITVTSREANYSVAATNTFTTNSFNIAQGSLLFVIASPSGGTQYEATFSGTGLSGWTTYYEENGTSGSGVTWGWVLVGAGGFSGTLDITFTGLDKAYCTWIVVEVTGANTTSPVVQYGVYNTQNTTNVPPLNAFADATNNVVLHGCSWAFNVGTPTAEAGYSYAGPVEYSYNRLLVQWLTGEDQTPTITFPSSRQNAGIAFELAMLTATATADLELTITYV